jgi:hypothetical protein
MAWKKTGLRPVNASMISETDLAPSREFSTTRALPLPPPSPIRAIIDAIHRQNAIRDTPHPDTPPGTPSLTRQPFLLTEITSSTSSMTTTTTLEHSLPNSGVPPIPTFHAPSGVFPSILPDPLALLTSGIDNLTLNDSKEQESASSNGVALVLGSGTSKEERANDTAAIYTAGEILRGLASTRLAPLLELETVTSAIELPPIQQGPLPTTLVNSIKKMDDPPPKELWHVFRSEFTEMVSRTEQLLAQNILQETYCQQVQRKLAVKEQTRKQSTLQKVAGLDGGLIFTRDEAHAILEVDAAVREKDRLDAEQKKKVKELVKEAKAWKESAENRQNLAHAALVAEWKTKPVSERTRRQPPKPPLDPVPPEYKEALIPKKRKPRKKRVDSSEEEEEEGESDASYR